MIGKIFFLISIILLPTSIFELYRIIMLKTKIKKGSVIKCRIVKVKHINGQNQRYYITINVDGQIVETNTLNSFAKRLKNCDLKDVVYLKGKYYFLEESFLGEIINSIFAICFSLITIVMTFICYNP